ncbi:MAG: Asp-tRNA(Asn)/Glu-tRNA(Gln) amidotransferase subunit GatA [Oscillospiraceae bacterium]
MELYKKYAFELSDMIKDKKISSYELTKSVFDRIEAVDNKIDAYITTVKDNALTQAKLIDERISKRELLNPLAGIPIGIKDNISTKGIKTTCASKMLGDYVPPFNATVIERINNAGMIITGKLNMDEFAMGSSTENSYFKNTKNPFDLSCVPGGSSGGSAAAVSACEAVVALGSDTGGSIRQPAAYCGVVGLKPTYGSVSRYGLVAFASSLDQIGPIGRCVKDVAMLQSVISGYDRMDSTSVYRDYSNYADKLAFNAKGLRIGIPDEYFGEGIDDCVKNAVLKAVNAFEKSGAVIKKISLPSTDYALSSYYILSSAEASSNLARFDGVKYGYRAKSYDGLTDMYEKTRSEGFGDEVKRRIMLGTFVLSSGYYDAYYKKAQLLRKRISAEFSAAFNDVDVIITPTVPTTAFKIGENIDDPLKMYSTDICTVTINIAGLPAVSIPCGKDKLGLPIGMQLIGDKFSEQKLLDAAYSYEQTVGGFELPVIL